MLALSYQLGEQFVHQLRSKSYDVVIDLQGNIKSGLVMGLAKGNRKVGFKAKQAPEWPNTIFSTERFETICSVSLANH